MPNIDLMQLLEANSTLTREKKELVRLINVLSQIIKEMSTAMEIYGAGTAAEASTYKSMPKGFTISLRNSRAAVEHMTKQARASVDHVDRSIKECMGEDGIAARAYYESLIEEMTKLSNKKKNQDMWIRGFRDQKGNWYFNTKDKGAAEFYKKYKQEIDKFFQDFDGTIPPPPFIDPNNFGGDLEGEWQDGQDE